MGSFRLEWPLPASPTYQHRRLTCGLIVRQHPTGKLSSSGAIPAPPSLTFTRLLVILHSPVQVGASSLSLSSLCLRILTTMPPSNHNAPHQPQCPTTTTNSASRPKMLTWYQVAEYMLTSRVHWLRLQGSNRCGTDDSRALRPFVY